MEFIGIDKLSDSVKKNNDIIDINLSNFNASFLVDNYSDENYKLRITDLRNEFNRLCKNKNETKNLDEQKFSVEDKNIYLCKENQVRDIPSVLKPMFIKAKNYYILGTPSNSSFIHCLLSQLDSSYIMLGDLQKQLKIDEIRNEMVFKLDDQFKEMKYNSRKFKKITIRDNLLNNKSLLPQTLTFIADYHKVCIIIIDTESHLYSLVNDYREDWEFIVMLRKFNYYQPILNSTGKHRFDYEILNRLDNILNPEIDIDRNKGKSDIKIEVPNQITDQTNQTNQTNQINQLIKTNKNNEPVMNNLGKERDYKIGELIAIAEKCGINILQSNGKKKLKKDLYAEIKIYYD